MIPRSLLALARVAATGRPVRLAYLEGGAAPSRPEVEVLAIGWRFDQWVALARHRVDGGLRVLEVHRVEAVRPLERRRRPRARSTAPATPSGGEAAVGVDPVEFALADLLDPDAGPAQRVTVRVDGPLAALAGALFAGAEVETGPGGACIRLLATNRPALSRMVASLGARLD